MEARGATSEEGLGSQERPRGILEWRFAHPGPFMFHAHQSEFTELGWQGFFEVV